MATETEDGRGVLGGNAQPVYLMNRNLPGTAPTGTQDVRVTSALPAGDNNIGNVDLASPIPAGTNNIGDVDLASAIPAGEAHLGQVGGTLATANVTLTRASGTTAYAAKDAIAATSPAVLTFAAMGRINGGSGYITKARMLTDQTTFATRLRLHLYHTAPSAIADNDPFTFLFANAANRIGYIDFDAAATEGTGSTAAGSINAIVRLPFVCAAGSQALYGLLETLDAFTPASGQQFFIELTADQN